MCSSIGTPCGGFSHSAETSNKSGLDRKSGVEGKRVDFGGRRIIKKKKRKARLWLYWHIKNIGGEVGCCGVVICVFLLWIARRSRREGAGADTGGTTIGALSTSHVAR